MAIAVRLMLVLLLASMGISTRAIATTDSEENKVSEEDEDIKSRSDYPDIDDLSSFFDFDLGTTSESNEKDYPSRYGRPNTSRPRRNKYYYYYKADGPRYYEDQLPPIKQVVTPGTHYKPQEGEEVVTTSVNDSKAVISQAVVGPYQVSVVDANSPMLSELGLKKEDLEKLSGHTKRSITNASLVGAASVPSATYAENPRPDYPQRGYGPNNHHQHPHPPPPNTHSYEPQHYGPPDHTERQYRPNDYYPADNHPPQRNYGPSPGPAQPPPQGSYDAKSYSAIQNTAHQHQASYNYGQPPPPQSQPSYNQYPPQAHNQYSAPPNNHYPAPQPSYAPKRSSDEPWRQVSPVQHTDWDDKQNKKPEYSSHNVYPPHPPPISHSNTPSNSVSQHQKPTYASSDKPGYRYATYSKPKTTYSAPSSAPSEYQPQKPSYHSSSGYSTTSAKAPSRAGAVSYASPSHHHHESYSESSKPGITIRFKAKSPSHHGGGGGGGLSIPVSLNPLDVMKKLAFPLSAFNPLNNKKVTIGITIENKKDPQPEYHSY